MASRNKTARQQQTNTEESPVGRLEVHEVTGAALDPEDPHFEQRRRIEDLRAEIMQTQQSAAETGNSGGDEVVRAALDAEEVRLRAELEDVRVTHSGTVEGTISHLREQAAQSEQKIEAVHAAAGTNPSAETSSDEEQ